MTHLPDAEARETAVADLGSNVVVVAGAGSGKTSLLIERLLGYLLLEEGSLRRACAITFTRKAAAEMLDRLSEELELFSELTASKQADQATAAGRLWERMDPKKRQRAVSISGKMLGSMDEAQISTIHSFCAGLLRRWAQVAGVSPEFEGDEGNSLDLLVQKHGAEILGGTLREIAAEELDALSPITDKALLEMMREASQFPPTKIGKEDSGHFATLGKLAAKGSDLLRTELCREGWLGFDDILQRTRNLLAEHEDIRILEQARWDHLLVDELQDTDPIQYEILNLLGQGQKSPKLFLVGDPKQSIYRFRGADLKAYELFCQKMNSKGSRVVLTTNFRSRSELLHPVNDLFEATMAEEKGVQPAYDPVKPNPFAKRESKAESARIRVVNQPPSAEKELVGDLRDREARIVVQEIQRMRAEGTEWGQILVLLPRLTGLENLAQAFHGSGIPFTAGGGKTFYKRQEVADFVALLTACLGPAQAGEDYATAVLALVRSPVGGIKDQTLFDYKQSLPEDAVFGDLPSKNECPDIYQALKRLEEWQKVALSTPEDEIPRILLDQSGLGVLWAMRKNGFQALANLEKAAESLSALVRESHFTLPEAIGLMGDRLGSGDDADQGTSEEGREAVTVLTVYKAKGLERERVILAGIQEKQTGGKSGLKVRPDSNGDWAVRINSKEKSSLWGNLEKEDVRHNRAERLRLLYVAMTRAKEELVLVQTGGDAHVKGNAWLEALEAGWGFRPEGPPPERHGILFTAPEEKAVTPAPGSMETPSTKEVLSAIEEWTESPPQPVALNASPSSIAHQISSHPPGSGIGGKLAAATGTLIHKLFEIWDFHSWESLRKPMSGEGAEIAEKECVPLSELLARATDILDRLPGTALGDLLLTLRQAQKYPELPALHKKDGKSWQGFIDLLYREQGGPWVVADFKTDASLAPEDAVSQYRAQLDLYGETIHAALGERPELKIFLLDTGVIADIPSQRANQ